MNIGHWSPQGWWGRGKLIGDFCFFFFFFLAPELDTFPRVRGVSRHERSSFFFLKSGGNQPCRGSQIISRLCGGVGGQLTVGLLK